MNILLIYYNIYIIYNNYIKKNSDYYNNIYFIIRILNNIQDILII